MNRGVEDRWKILNIVMLMSFAKDVAPYMLMYNPGMLPSTFSARWYDDGRGGEGKGDGDGGVTQGYVEDLIKTDRVRAHAVIKTLNDIEVSCVTPTWLESLNPFGGKGKQRMEVMGGVREVVRTALSMNPDKVCEEFLEKFAVSELGDGKGKKREKKLQR